MSLKSENGLWFKCFSCNEILYKNQIEENFYICPKCGNYFRIGWKEYLKILADEGTFRPLFENIRSDDPLEFRDVKKYKKRLKETQKKTSLTEAVKCGTCSVNLQRIAIGILDFAFMGGSMGSAVGERLTLLIEKAANSKLPLVIVSASGGARMHEGIYSLMQMAKTAGALALLAKKRVPYISILTNPTTGGVSASFAFLGDVIISEPRALIGFAGPRVIEQTIRQKLPEGFQRAEFLLEKGQIDMIVTRRNLKDVVSRVLKIFL
ncbi:MAG: acetyl-CoA carboxylase carboxyltransferase subunit beta [Elusimicrobia bacterium]|nr:acetyl-CoA carboxylase carboxyltransferase subunit beta [Elusimicrobiota bacterium]